MSGIALVLHERGFKVTGSDLKTSRYVRQLTRAGVEVHVGHEAATIDAVQPDVVVVSTAIPETNPELMRARELGIPVWHRAKMLSALGYGRTTVAAAGTHGKTTTSSMVATMLDRMGLDPSFLIGGVVEGYGTNGKNGDGEYFVVEADESDSSFLYLNPHVVIVTNVGGRPHGPLQLARGDRGHVLRVHEPRGRRRHGHRVRRGPASGRARPLDGARGAHLR